MGGIIHYLTPYLQDAVLVFCWTMPPPRKKPPAWPSPSVRLCTNRLILQTMPALKKYLQHYAEPEAGSLGNFPATYSQGIVLPLYKESFDVFKCFSEFANAQPGTLLIMVLNHPDTSDENNGPWSEAFFATGLPPLWQSADQLLQLLDLANGSAALLIDRCLQGPPLPAEQGVGLARKIGADILCQLIHDKKVQSPWIHTSDADTSLPEDYFTTLATPTIPAAVSSAACLYPFRHVFEDAEARQLPTLIYEFSLHYYVDGLRWANSAYAFHTVGSTIAVHYQSYAKVRGFPRKAAGEDFYLLNKLAKTGNIESLQRPALQIAARDSNRTPFGTAPTVSLLSAMPDPRDKLFYHPDSFVYLHCLLQLQSQLCEKSHASDIATQATKLLRHNAYQDLQPQLLAQAIEAMDLGAALKHAFQHGKTTQTRLRQMQHWFDAFKTLKFIHYLRDNGLGSQAFFQLAAKPPQLLGINSRHLLTAIGQCQY